MSKVESNLEIEVALLREQLKIVVEALSLIINQEKEELNKEEYQSRYPSNPSYVAHAALLNMRKLR